VKVAFATALSAWFVPNVTAMTESALMVVPVRAGSGMVSLRCGRLPSGERVGIAFTTEERLAETMGTGQEWIRLHERALRAMLRPLGVTRIQLDPRVLATTPAASAVLVAV
jgi:hypothetical protein